MKVYVISKVTYDDCEILCVFKNHDDAEKFQVELEEKDILYDYWVNGVDFIE